MNEMDYALQAAAEALDPVDSRRSYALMSGVLVALFPHSKGQDQWEFEAGHSLGGVAAFSLLQWYLDGRLEKESITVSSMRDVIAQGRVRPEGSLDDEVLWRYIVGRVHAPQDRTSVHLETINRSSRVVLLMGTPERGFFDPLVDIALGVLEKQAGDQEPDPKICRLMEEDIALADPGTLRQ